MAKEKFLWVILWVLVCGFAAKQIFVYYQSMPVEVKIGERIVCSDPGHQGNRVLKNTVKTIEVPRKEAGNYKVIEKEIVCPVCQERRREEEKQVKIRQEREEREARERAEVEEIMRNLEVKFGLNGSVWGTSEKYLIGEASLRPGQEIGFGFYIKNNSPNPIEESLRVLVEPGAYLRIQTPEEYYGPFWNGWAGVDHVQTYAPKFKKLVTSGLKICDRVYPYDSPYYPKFRAVGWSTYEMWLALKKSVKPGQDIHFNGYIIIKGHKIPVGTVTVHVMYPD